MTIQLSTAARNAACDGVVDLLDTGTVEIRTGVRPANPAAAATGTILGTFTLPNPAFGAASVGVATANAITGVTASGTGTASWFRAYRSAGNGSGAVIDGDVATSGADMTIQNTSVNSGQALTITAWTHTQPELPMSDAKIDIQEAAAPTHSVDGEALLNDVGQTVFRQKIADEDVANTLATIRHNLRILVGLAPAREPATHASRVAVQGTVPVSGSLTTVTTLAGQTNIGGLPAQNEQFGHGAVPSALLVQRSVRWVLHSRVSRASTYRCRCLATSCQRLPRAAQRRALGGPPTRR